MWKIDHFESGPLVISTHNLLIISLLLHPICRPGLLCPCKQITCHNGGQFVERSLPSPEVRGSKPVIGRIYIVHCLLHWKDENKEKEAGNGPSKTTFKGNFFTILSTEVVQILVEGKKDLDENNESGNKTIKPTLVKLKLFGKSEWVYGRQCDHILEWKVAQMFPKVAP